MFPLSNSWNLELVKLESANFDNKIMNSRILSVLAIQMGDIYTFLHRMGKENFVKHHPLMFRVLSAFLQYIVDQQFHTSESQALVVDLRKSNFMNYSKLILRPLDGQKTVGI